MALLKSIIILRTQFPLLNALKVLSVKFITASRVALFFQNPNWFSLKSLCFSRYWRIWLFISFPVILKNRHNIEIGQWFSHFLQSPFLYSGLTRAILNLSVTVQLLILRLIIMLSGYVRNVEVALTMFCYVICYS